MEVVECGWREGSLLMSGGRRWGGSESFSDLLGRGQNFSISHHEKCIAFLGEGVPPKPPITPTIFGLFSIQLKDIHKNYSSISDYFLSNILTTRLS